MLANVGDAGMPCPRIQLGVPAMKSEISEMLNDERERLVR